MAEIAPTPAVAPAKTAKKKSSKSQRTGPSVSELIVKAVAASKERSGVSATALKKNLAAGGYDVDKNKSRIKTAIKSLVAKGTLVQTKGTGASGSFKMSKKAAEPKAKKPAKKAAPKVKKAATKKAPASKKPKAATVAAKKPAAAKKSPKKVKAAKKPAAIKKTVKSPKKASKPKSPKKVTKKAPATKKSPAKKAVKPKVKKAAPKKK